jgi:hypothetical protein
MWWTAIVKSEWEVAKQVPTQTWLRPVTTCVYKPQAAIQLELIETCWAFNERWNNKLYYEVASCWLFFLLSHTAMHGYMNIKLSVVLPAGTKCQLCGRLDWDVVTVAYGMLRQKTVSLNLTPRPCFTPVCFTSFCFNASYQITKLSILRPFTFELIL